VAHEFEFANVATPVQHVVLGLPLRDYSLGHRLLFLRQRNPLVFSSEKDFNALPFETQIMWLIEAVTICNQTYAYRREFEASPTWKMIRQALRDAKKWRKLRAKAESKSADLMAYWSGEILAFRNYLSASTLITEFDQRRDPFPFLPCKSKPDADGRTFGGPYDATLMQFLLQSRLCASRAECLEFPFAEAEMHYLTHLEREGALDIFNSDDMAFKDELKAHNEKAAKEAGFDTVEAHVAHGYAEAMKAKVEKQAAAVKESEVIEGLPPEMKGTT